jgi:hypothetical protein
MQKVRMYSDGVRDKSDKRNDETGGENQHAEQKISGGSGKRDEVKTLWKMGNLPEKMDRMNLIKYIENLNVVLM